MIELTSHRKDEALLIEEAWRIADSVEHDDEALADLAIPLSESFARFAMPFGGAPFPILRAVTDSAGTTVLELPAFRMANVSSLEDCRGYAITTWAVTLQQAATQGMTFSRPIEMRIACPTSSVTLRFDREEERMTIRQVDASGGVSFEEQVPASFWLLPSWG
jgi:hypothetical protein